MKATGIIRRIDDLGRIVIPKEIRRGSFIRNGDPLEIYTGNEGEIILKKYSLLQNIETWAEACVNALYKTIRQPVIIFDNDGAVCGQGMGKGTYKGKPIPQEVQEIIDDRVMVDGLDIPIFNNDLKAQIISPILLDGDIVGAIVVCKNNSDEKPSEQASMHSINDVVKNSTLFLAGIMENGI